jgi:cell division protein FtsB
MAKSVKKQRLGYLFLFGFSAILLLYMCGILIENIVRYNRFKREYDKVALDFQQTVELNMQYRHQLQAMSKPDYWETSARLRLGLVFPDEVIYRVVP